MAAEEQGKEWEQVGDSQEERIQKYDLVKGEVLYQAEV
jgi:hypothetical protein